MVVVDRWVVGDLRGAAVAMAAGGRGDSGGSYKNKQLHTHLPHRSRCGGVLPEPAVASLRMLANRLPEGALSMAPRFGVTVS